MTSPVIRLDRADNVSVARELSGIEHILIARALLERIEWWLTYTDGRDVQMQGVVGPGNMAEGLANIIEKSLGGAKKGAATGQIAGGQT